MAKPNSLTTLLRRWLVYFIDPMPPIGEAWCLDCRMNDGKTLPLHASQALAHLDAHRGSRDPWVSIRYMTEKGKK